MEYGLLVGLIAVVCIAAITLLGNNISAVCSPRLRASSRGWFRKAKAALLASPGRKRRRRSFAPRTGCCNFQECGQRFPLCGRPSHFPLSWCWWHPLRLRSWIFGSSVFTTFSRCPCWISGNSSSMASRKGGRGWELVCWGALFGLGILIPFCLMGGMGAGDVKLLAGVGAWLGLPITFLVFILSGLAAGVYAIVLILLYGKIRQTWVNLQIMWHRMTAVGRYLGSEDLIEIEASRPDRRSHLIPFGAMVAFGIVTLLVWAWMGQKS